MADVIADENFKVVIAVRFRRRGENQMDYVRKLISSELDGRGEISMKYLTITADRGFDKY